MSRSVLILVPTSYDFDDACFSLILESDHHQRGKRTADDDRSRAKNQGREERR